MPITRTAWIDSDGSPGSGSVLDNAAKTALYDQIDAALTATASAPTTTGTETALPLPATGSGPLVTHFNNATLRTIQGMVAGTHGQLWFQFSKGAGQVDYAHLHASGTALGKLKLFATSGLTSLAAGSGVAVFQYDATVTQWRLVHHQQGALIAVPHAAGNFTGNGAQTWTVDVGDQTHYLYALDGRWLSLLVSLNTWSTGGTPNTQLKVTFPAGFTSAAGISQSAFPSYVQDNGALKNAADYYVIGDTNSGFVRVGRNDFANWAVSTNNGILTLATRLVVN